MPTLKTLTLGCKVNQYETEYVRQGLSRLGYREPRPGEAADLCVVNTCTVTAEADRKSRKLIRQLARENPGASIIVMGCYATRRPDEAAALPGVAEVVTDKNRLPELLARFGLDPIPTGITSFGRRQRAYVKIQDGCRMECAYCIIPRTRPVLRSRPIDEVVGEIRGLIDGGYQEIVLTGIHLGHYGVDLAGHDRTDAQTNLARLLRHLVRLDGDFRIRISSIEACEVTDAVLDVIAEHPKRVCPHLHVSMQSGSDTVLQRMRRRWSSERFLERCRTIKRRLDHPGLTTDVIVGFPGETEAEFEATCRLVENVGFSKIHGFRFSARPGTAAARMTDVVPSHVQHRRLAKLAQIETRLRTSYFSSLLGRELCVLVESAAANRPGMLLGTSARYVPVELPGQPHQVGRLVRVTAQSLGDNRVLAEAIHGA
ncbi:MAG: tRNA (N(6)-L-threonylcarbamoyladenosine(37)-C(2))-methylthiotransferase MtaB [Pirellulales bacterium]|nr:tRNA (N(6)-L-threonylcarbamoyladenosine(37)-C(2))-methylthiotransferase MtaB [Pirellulales bacterium]